jgi:iron(III) transport system substrate-binding protein
VGPEAQGIYASVNNEYPVSPAVPPSEIVKSFGTLKPDAVPLDAIAKYRAKASEIMDRVRFDDGPAS